MINPFTVIDKEYCIINCWDFLKAECLKVCSLDVYSLTFMFGVLVVSLIMRHILVKKISPYLQKELETEYNILLLIQFVLMLFSIIFLVISIKHKYFS